MKTKLLTEIREYGDKRTVVLYTNDNEIYRRLRDSRKCLEIVPYEQEQNGKTIMVGVDLYFSRKNLRWLEKVLRDHGRGNF